MNVVNNLHLYTKIKLDLSGLKGILALESNKEIFWCRGVGIEFEEEDDESRVNE